MKSIKYLIDVQKKAGINDTELGKLLGVTQAAISQYKSGKRIMDDETCLAIAINLGIDPLQIIGAACIDRAEKTGQRSLWEGFMERMAATASVILVSASVNLFLTPEKAEAAPLLGYSHSEKADSLYYVKLMMLWTRWKSAIQARFKRLFSRSALQPATRH